ncbi:hypothetical protein BDV32DRAFT_149188 [Aspergillus pseudonomiae]|nr:hypothetical protein BDV32DRAFT_149188 [Aspergillus pseudonomiae]
MAPYLVLLVAMGVQFTLAVATSPPSCPPGALFDGEYCRIVELASCPSGTILSGSQCVTGSLPQCPPGTTLDRGHCIALSQPSCPPGQILRAGTCFDIRRSPDVPSSCPSGTHFDGKRCVSAKVSDEHDPISCPAGAFYDGNKCVVPGSGSTYESKKNIYSPSCPAGTSFDGKYCLDISADGRVSREWPSCPSGTIFTGGNCVGF